MTFLRLDWICEVSLDLLECYNASVASKWPETLVLVYEVDTRCEFPSLVKQINVCKDGKVRCIAHLIPSAR